MSSLPLLDLEILIFVKYIPHLILFNPERALVRNNGNLTCTEKRAVGLTCSAYTRGRVCSGVVGAGSGDLSLNPVPTL